MGPARRAEPDDSVKGLAKRSNLNVKVVRKLLHVDVPQWDYPKRRLVWFCGDKIHLTFRPPELPKNPIPPTVDVHLYVQMLRHGPDSRTGTRAYR